VIKFAYEVLRESDGQLLCEGETTHVICDKEMKKSPMPEKFAVRFRALGIQTTE
jgi:acyl-CoA thioester hydrolase